MSNYSFNKGNVQNVIDAAAISSKQDDVSTPPKYWGLVDCISVDVKDAHVCFNLPFVGERCIAIPSHFLDSQEAKACLWVCIESHFKVGFKVTISIDGNEVLSTVFGHS